MNFPSFSLTGKVAIVTGARTGIGRAIALAFAGVGADVAINDLIVDDGRLNAVADEIRGMGRRCLVIQADVTDKSAVNNLVTYVVDEFGAIDVLLNNVGVMVRKPLIEYSEEEWDRVIDINLKSAFLCSQAVSRVMVTQKKGSIINMSSVCAIKASTTRGGYHVAKAGVSMLTKTLALELAGSKVRVNAIAPGGVKTDWNTREWNNSENLKRPMQRMAETYEITGAAIFLASEASSYITGHVLLVDGGESL